MKCADCGYYWKENWDDHPGCHFVGPHEWAPCEQEDDHDDDYDDDAWYEDEFAEIDDDVDYDDFE